MAVLGVSSITPAFPGIQKEFGISTQKVGLLITIFTLPGIILTPILGVLADRIGRKTILIPAIFLFGIAGVVCGFTRSFDLLLLFRFLQGVGAASLGSLNVTLISDFYSGSERPAAMGYNASILSVGTAAYPSIGGALASIAWYYPFFLPVFAIPIGLIALIYLDRKKDLNEQKLSDYLKTAWQSIKDKRVIAVFIASIVTFIILYGSYLSYFPFLLHYKFSSEAYVIGIFMSVMSLSTAITSSRLGKLTEKYSEKSLLKAAFFFYIISLAIFPFIQTQWLLIIPLILFGIGQGLNIPSLQTLLANLAPSENRAAFMSMNGTVLRLGQTLGPLVMGAIFGWLGITAVFIAGALLAAGMLIVVFKMIEE